MSSDIDEVTKAIQAFRDRMSEVGHEERKGRAYERGRLSAAQDASAKLKREKTLKHPDDPLSLIERRSLLVIIEALARYQGIDTARPEAAGVIIERLTEQLGARVDHNTIARHLRLIPDAIDARAK